MVDKASIKKFKIRMAVIWGILTGKYPSWIFIRLTEEDALALIKEEDFNTDIAYHGLMNYNCKRIFRALSDGIDDEDIILDKAKFEAEASVKNKPKLTVKCLLCGRKFVYKMPHNCNDGFRKRKIKWEDIE